MRVRMECLREMVGGSKKESDGEREGARERV